LKPLDSSVYAGLSDLLACGDALGFHILQNARTEAIRPGKVGRWSNEAFEGNDSVIAAQLHLGTPPWVIHQFKLVALVIAPENFTAVPLPDLKRGAVTIDQIANSYL
jgi:hypothetical protein